MSPAAKAQEHIQSGPNAFNSDVYSHEMTTLFIQFLTSLAKDGVFQSLKKLTETQGQRGACHLANVASDVKAC